MKKTLLLGSLGLLISGFAALAASGCDNGSTGGTGGAGGAGASNGPASSTTNSGPGTSSSTGMALTLESIDDMEDMDGSITMAGGRQGAWYVYNDGTGTQTPPVDPMGMAPFPMSMLMPARGSSKYGAHTSGMGFMTWGAGFGFDLNNTGGAMPKKLAYDASKYAGIHFWAKSSSPGAVRFNVGDGNTTPEGMKCMSGGMMPTCSDDFGQNLALATDWTEYTIKFSDMTQVGWAMQKLPAIDKTTLYSVHFQAGTGVTFDIWIDDIAFFL